MRYLLLRLKRFCGFLAGFVFFIGGILKLLDPVGAGLIMKEYFDFLHLGFLDFSSKITGVSFAFAETVIGTGLITGIWRKEVGFAALLFQGFFTLLTLLLVIFNPEMDCGCFGEAIHLTHMQTFVKNLILAAMLSAYYFPTKLLGRNKKLKYVSFSLVTVSVIAFTVYSWMYIPLVDFTAFKPASTLHTSENAANEEYDAVFVYEKDGEEKTFTLNDLPDSTWNFVRTETIQKNSSRGTSDIILSFYDKDGEYRDELAKEGDVIVVSVYDTDIRENKWEKISDFIGRAESAGFKCLLLTSSTSAATSGIESYTSDYKTLITLNRSNGGATYFHNGILIRKWAFRSLPSSGKLLEMQESDYVEDMTGNSTHNNLAFQGFLLYVFAIMLLL